MLETDPANPALRAGLHDFYAGHEYEIATPSRALLDRIARGRDPGGLALALVGAGEGRLSSSLGQSVLFAALARQPQQPVLWYELARRTYDPAARAAFLAEAAGRARALGERGDRAAARLSAEVIADLCANGLFEQALDAFGRLSERERRALTGAAQPAIALDVLGLPLRLPARDLRLDLAMAEAVAGDARRAAAYVAGVPWHVRAVGGAARPSPATRMAALVHCAIGDVPGDPFRFVATALPSAESEQTLGSAGRWLLLAAVAARQGAAHLGAYALENAQPLWMACDGCDGDATAQGVALPRAVLDRAAFLRADLDRLAANAERERTALLESLDAGDRVARGVGERSRQRLRPVFATVDPPRSEPGEETVPSPESDEPGLVRFDAGESTPGLPDTAIVDRDDIDPGGAFWLELRRGTHTTDAVFTGLSARRYTVLAHSTLPLLDGDTVQIEARDGDTDPADPEAEPPRVVLRAALADLRADSDGDGVSDVVERRWLTDPERADTDGDGLEDAVDPSPLVPAGRPSPLAEPLALALATIFGVTTAVPAPNGPAPCCHGLVLPTEFVVAPRSLLTGVAAADRLLVVTQTESDLLPEGQGLAGALHLRLIYFDAAIDHGLVEWIWDNGGGTLRLDRRADGWHATQLVSWVS